MALYSFICCIKQSWHSNHLYVSALCCNRALQAAQVRANQPITVQHNVKVIGSGPHWIILAHAFGDNQQVRLEPAQFAYDHCIDIRINTHVGPSILNLVALCM